MNKKEKYTDLLDEVLGAGSDILPDNLRLVLVALRGEYQETRMMRMASEKRLESLETLVATHIKSCEQRDRDTKDMIEIMKAIEGSLKVANWMKKFVTWTAGVLGGFYAIYTMFKGVGGNG